MDDAIRAFLTEGPWAVAGASSDREKFGNKVLRSYLQADMTPVYALNPKERTVEGMRAYPDLASVPERVRALSVITPPPVTERLVEEAAEAGVELIWMQPGAASSSAVRRAEEHGLTVIAGGPCFLVEVGFPE